MNDVILRQLALAAAPDGTIGNDGKLLFTSRTDMNNFAQFTKHTVLVCGRHTANEMINSGVRPNTKRPMVIVTENGCVSSALINKNAAHSHIFYAKNTPTGIRLAEEISGRYDLNGYTICGGKQLYDEFLDNLDAGAQMAQINRAYLFSAHCDDMDTAKSPIKLKRDMAQIRAVIKSRMMTPRHSTVKADGSVCLSAGAKYQRAFDCTYEWFDDVEFVDTSCVRPTSSTDSRIKLHMSNGTTVIDTNNIAYWVDPAGTNSITIYLNNGHSIDVRLSRPSSMVWLKAILNAL